MNATQQHLERTMLSTSLHAEPRNVILTAGMVNATSGERIYGVFLGEGDARSPQADELCIATVGADDLTDEQIAMAERNTDRLGS